MVWFGPPAEGDWVTARRAYSAGFVDAVTGAETVRKGDRGVVLDTRTAGFFDPRSAVRFDTGWGSREVLIPVRHLRVISRGRGAEKFARRASTMRWIRLGALAAILAPMLWFVVTHIRDTGSTDGLVAELAVGAVHGTFDMLEYLLTDPVRAVVFLVLSSAAVALAAGKLR